MSSIDNGMSQTLLENNTPLKNWRQPIWRFDMDVNASHCRRLTSALDLRFTDSSYT